VAPRLRATLEGSAVSLALLRVAVAIVVLVSPELHDARRLAADPGALVVVPEGMGLLARIPWTPALARALHVVALSSGVTALLGFASRASMLALGLSAGVLFSLSQRQGAVLHDMHLFWMAALLAASPCGDALSLDAWDARERPPRSLRYGVPAAFARALLGAVYFFPGLHKVLASGLAWASASNLQGHMWAKWLQHGSTPALRIDQHPWLLVAGGVFVLAFELSFGVLAVASARTRVVAGAAGFLFHAATQVFFFIPFTSLWACYAVLVDPRRHDPSDDRPPLALSIIVGATLLVAAVVQGARGHTQAWPFACYPTFEHMQPAHIPDLVVELTLDDGTTTRLSDRAGRPRSEAGWGHVFRISGAYGDAPDQAALSRWAREVAVGAGYGAPAVTMAPGAASGLGAALEPARLLRVYRVEAETAPERWWGRADANLQGASPGVLLTELPLP
jgi:hypothetical protein